MVKDPNKNHKEEDLQQLVLQTPIKTEVVLTKTIAPNKIPTTMKQVTTIKPKQYMAVLIQLVLPPITSQFTIKLAIKKCM